MSIKYFQNGHLSHDEVEFSFFSHFAADIIKPNVKKYPFVVKQTGILHIF